MNNLLVTKAAENEYFIRNMPDEIDLKDFYSKNSMSFGQHDKLDNQLKMFFGFDPEKPEASFYPDLLIIDDSDFVRGMYKLKLNEMSIKK